MILPCKHDPNATNQVQPAIELLRTLDTKHPDVLTSHGLVPAEYHPKLIFRSAVESIRGTYIASSLTQRHGLVADALEVMKLEKLIVNYRPLGARQRFDFEVMVNMTPKLMCALEVKGGEGNSINISERPLWASEFILWCHLDGAIVNQPSHGAEAIIFNRVANEMVKRAKHVDAIVFKDARCNTPLRPCPKYHQKVPPTELGVAPDIFLLPQEIPSEQNPNPPAHDLNTTQLPAKILSAYGVNPKEFDEHVWQVTIEIIKHPTGLFKDIAERTIRETKVFYKGRQIMVRRSSR